VTFGTRITHHEANGRGMVVMVNWDSFRGSTGNIPDKAILSYQFTKEISVETSRVYYFSSETMRRPCRFRSSVRTRSSCCTRVLHILQYASRHLTRHHTQVIKVVCGQDSTAAITDQGEVYYCGLESAIGLAGAAARYLIQSCRSNPIHC